MEILLQLIRTGEIDLNELYGIKPEDTDQAKEAAGPETRAAKTEDKPKDAGNGSASGEGGKA